MSVWLKFGLVALGGALGAMARVAMSEAIALRAGAVGFAWGTLMVNLLGCVLIGMARAGVDLVDWGSPAARIMVFGGFLGAFTTFSTFEADTVMLWQGAQRGAAALYLGLSVGGGLLAYFMGWFLVARASGTAIS